ncbi:MAG: SLBB domain-containing protein [Methylotenera sp.]
MIVFKKSLRFAFSSLLMLSFSCVWAAGGTSSVAGSGSGLSTSSSLSSLGSQAAVQANTPSATASEPSAKSQEQKANIESAPNQDQVTGINESQFKSEFQNFVAQSVGHALPMYGYDLFHKAPNTFAPVDHIPVTPDYTIGPGDELLVHMWGQVEANQSVVVDRNGMINLPKVGPVSVVGVRYQNLQQHLKAAVSRMFQNFELDVSLGKLRSIQVFVVGQAARPGNYTVSSLSTLVNALFASGGPSAKGSMRHIQLKRSGKVITEFDMYDLLLKGDKSKDVQLLPGDVIYIPTIGAMAAIAGSVNTSAIFELNDKETLSDLLNLAGGLTNVAAGQKVAVERIHEREMRKVEEFSLDKDGLTKPMQDGDLVTVYSISSRFDNAITLRGNIAIPGRHPWKEGLRISDVIPDKGALISDSYWLKQNQTSRTEVSSSGSLRNEVKRSLAEVNWDYAVVERLNSRDLTTSLIPFNLGKAVIDHEPQQNLLLQPGDVITIFSKDDIQVPVASRTKYVVLEGELAHPGVYQVQTGETLRQLVMRVGGTSPQAYLFGSEFSREATRQMQQKRLDEILARMEADIQRNAASKSTASLSKEDVESAKAEAQAQQALLAKMRQVKATGRIVLEIPEYAVELKNLPDLALEDGDRLFIPSVPSTVSVMGTVYNQNAFIYRKGQSVSDYLEKAGGPTRDGDQDDVYLVRVDGLVFSKRQSGFMFGNGSFNGRLALPGDTVVVPEKLEKYNLTKDFKDWTQIFYQFAIGIASFKVIGLF